MNEGTKAAHGTFQDLPAFKLERYFARWEFSAPHLLCCSDCEPLKLAELLQLADPDSKRMYEELRLGYGETRGLPELRAEVAEMYDSVKPEGVIVAAPQECIYLAMRALLRPGDHVVVTYPGYQSLFQVAVSLGCEVSRWEAELQEDGGAAFDVAAFESLLRPTTRLAVVNFPHNPTGALPSRDEWGRLVAACRARDAVLFSDEMYRMMEFDPADRRTSAVDLYDKAITLSGVSKAFGLPGLRIGWLAVRPPLYDVLSRVAELKDYTTICNSGPSEVLALMALRARDAILARNLGIVRANLEAVAACMARHPDTFRYRHPRAGSVAFPRLVGAPPSTSSAGADGLVAGAGGDAGGRGGEAAAAEDIEAFCDRLVCGCGVLLLPGTVYDHGPSAAQGHFRIGLGRRDLPACLAVLEGFLTGAGAGAGGAPEGGR